MLATPPTSRSSSGRPGIEKELKALFSRAKMPSSPALAAQILELANDPTATVDQFANLIQMDVVLAGKLLNLANSSYYAQRSAVTTIQRAVALLGINRVRTVSLGFQLVGHLDRLGGCPFDMKTFWQHALLRGCLAREFAERVVPSCAEEAFLIGLLQDCGILLLVQLLGADYADLYKNGGLSPTAFYAAERKRFRYNHVEAVVTLAREWNLPDEITQPLAKQHTPIELSPDSDDFDRIKAISYFVGSIRLEGHLIVDASEPTLDTYAQDVLNLDEAALAECFKYGGEAYTEIGQVLHDSLPRDLDVTDLLSQANACLTSAAGDAEQRCDTAEQERERASREQENLQSALGEYRERAARDPLTGILNRGALLDVTREIIQTAQADSSTVVAAFIDIDNFKRLNDTFGHQAGDLVLKSVANSLTGLISNGGVLGRYGGEEFVIALPSVSEDQARVFAEDIVKAVRGVSYAELGIDAPVTCSVGAVWGTPDADATAESVFAAADHLMYKAKRKGKNQACYRRMDGRETPTAAATKAAVDALVHSDPASERQAAIRKTLRSIALRLNAEEAKQLVKTRKQGRKDLVSPCKIAIFRSASFQLSEEDAFVRNLSTGGIGLVTARALIRGEPVEVSIVSESKPILFVAGIVAFCRHIEGITHEIGVQLMIHAKEPILSADPIGAIRSMDWVAEALQALKSRDGGTGGH